MVRTSVRPCIRPSVCRHANLRTSERHFMNFRSGSFFSPLVFTMTPSLIETNYPFYSDLIFAKGIVASGVAQRFDLFILTCLCIVFRRATVGRTPLDE